MLRKPILPIEDDVVIQLKVLNTEFKCPVCLGILHDTNAIMEVILKFNCKIFSFNTIVNLIQLVPSSILF